MPELLLVGPNPVKKIKRKQNPVVSTPALKRKKNPITNLPKSPMLGKMGKVKRRKNPIGASDIYDLLMQAGIGAAGAVGNDFAAGYILPTLGLRVDYSDPVYMAAKAVMALAAGEILSDATKGLSYQMASGALSVTMSDYARTVIKASAPTVVLGNKPIPALSNVYVAGSRPGMPALAGYGDRGSVVLPVAAPCGCKTNTTTMAGRASMGNGYPTLNGLIETEPRLAGRGGRGRR